MKLCVDAPVGSVHVPVVFNNTFTGLVPELPDVPLLPLVPDEPLVPFEPLDPDVPELPLEPDVPELPVPPLVPDVPPLPDEPFEPDVPLEPDVPSLTVTVGVNNVALAQVLPSSLAIAFALVVDQIPTVTVLVPVVVKLYDINPLY